VCRWWVYATKEFPPAFLNSRESGLQLAHLAWDDGGSCKRHDSVRGWKPRRERGNKNVPPPSLQYPAPRESALPRGRNRCIHAASRRAPRTAGVRGTDVTRRLAARSVKIGGGKNVEGPTSRSWVVEPQNLVRACRCVSTCSCVRDGPSSKFLLFIPPFDANPAFPEKWHGSLCSRSDP